MHLTVACWDDRVIPIEIDGGESIETLRMILEVESAVPSAQQQLFHNNRMLPQTGQLSGAGVVDQDMIMLLPPQAAQQQQQPAPAGGQQQQQQRVDPAAQLNADGSAQAPAAFIQHMKANAAMLQQLRDVNPALAAAIDKEDISAMQVGQLRHHRVAGRAVSKCTHTWLLCDVQVAAYHHVSHLIHWGLLLSS
jgi:DNA damage-inducible protein 1